MPANAAVAGSEPVDAQAVVFRAYFQESGDGETTGNYAGYQHSYCKKIVLQSGILPSYALCEIPLGDGAFDQTAPARTAVNGGPLDKIRIGTPAKVIGILGDNSLTVLTGFVVETHQDLVHDSLVVEIADARYLLQAIAVVGSWWMSGTAGYAYRQGWRARINPGGQPNMIHCDTGTERVPMFCHSNHGLAQDEAPEDPNASSLTLAANWTIPKVLEYLRWHTSAAALALVSGKFPWYASVPSSIDWPKSWAEIISVDSPESQSRKAPEMVLSGDNVLEVIEKLLSSAGGFSFYLGPKVDENADKSQNFKSKVQVVRTKYRGGGVTINRAAGGNAADTFAESKICTGGTLGESGKHLYTKFASAGQLVAIERRRDTGASAGLIQAWSAADETAWEDSVKADLGLSLSLDAAVRNANRKYPNVFAAWKLDETTDFQAGTSEAGMPLAQVGRPVFKELLTSYLEAATATQTDKRRFRVPVFPEYSLSGTYRLCTIGDGLSLDNDGTIWLTQLREIPSAYGDSTHLSATETYSFSVPPTSAAVSAAANNMRMTLAIPCDHRLVKSTRLPVDPTSAIAAPAAGEFDDNDRIDRNLSRLHYADCQELSGLEVRYVSWPTPQSVQGSAQAGNATIRNDGDELTDHAAARRADKGRIGKPCSLVFPYVSPVWSPGQSLKNIRNAGLSSSSYFLGRVVTRVVFETSPTSQKMLVEAE